MKSKSYKNYRVCSICQRALPLSREYFKRYGDNTGYHKVCKECETKKDIEKEWKGGLLLCHDCLQYKEIDCFTPKGSKSKNREYRRYICKDCTSKRQRKHDLNLSTDKKLEKCLRFRFLGARDRASKHGIPFTLSFDYIINLWKKQKGLCAISGISMTFELKSGRTPTNVSIDKINKDGGYVVGNVQLVCMACNQIKSDLTEEEMYNFCKKIVEQYEDKNKKSTSAA